METALLHSTELNNEGILHMNCGEFVRATECLTRSLRIVKDIMARGRHPRTSNQARKDSPRTRIIEETIIQRQAEEPMCLDLRHERSSNRSGSYMDTHMMGSSRPQQALNEIMDQPTLQCGIPRSLLPSNYECQIAPTLTPYIYQVPLVICTPAVMNRALTDELLGEISVAILFNLALCHQLRAYYSLTEMENGERQELLSRAISLFELAYGIQMQEDVELSVECTMAIINNLGQMHRQLGDEDKAKRCFSQLLSTLVFVQTASYGENTDEALRISRAGNEGFIQSVSHLILKGKVAPAA